MSDEKETFPETFDAPNGNPGNDPATKLLREAPLAEGKDLLLIEGGNGQLASHFAPRFKNSVNHNTWYPDHFDAGELLKKSAPSVHCLLSDIPQADAPGGMPSGSFDAILFRLARGTATLNAVLCESFRLLRIGGVFWVSGHNKEGIKSFVKRSEAHFGNANLARIKSSCRLVGFKKESERPVNPVEDPHYFEYQDLEINIPRLGNIAYSSKPGIFSYRTTDLGTALLAKFLPDCAGKTVLDLGCGSGVLSVAAGKAGAASVLAVDANAIATQCTVRNFERHSLPGKVLCTHLTEGLDTEFDIVLSNPPFHQGHATDYSLPGKILDAIIPRLKTGGSIYLVANRFLDYAAQGATRFQKVEVLAREQGYCVYRMDR